MSTIQERIAALNLGQVGRMPGSPPGPSQPRSTPAIVRSSSADDQSSHTASQDAQTVGNQPMGKPSRPLPPPPPRPDARRPPPPARPSTQQGEAKAKPPPLPSRQSQQSIARRESQESMSSTVSTRSSLSLGSSRTSTSAEARSVEVGSSRMKAPAYDAASLPALPPSRREQPPASNRPSLPNRRSSSTAAQAVTKTALNKTTTAAKTTTTTPPPPQPRFIAPSSVPSTATPGLPPRPPARSITQEPAVTKEPAPRPAPRPAAVADSQPKPTPVRRSALSFGMNSSTEKTPTIPSRPVPEGTNGSANGDTSGGPPPIPLGSRPDLAALQASKPKMNSSGTFNTPTTSVGASATSCMECRDFSGPDSHAARFPRQGLPTQDLTWLGQQLGKPFDSPTDKARAIFTWLHHNIAYNVEAFFSGNLKASTPASTLSSGLAVCEGYGALFVALATHAGLEAVVVGGHGKGYGYNDGDPVPSGGPTGHAWAAVKIDNGEWKLTDPCWGAGHVTDQQKYEKRFSPAQFTMSNEEFGETHFPENPRFFFVANPPSFAQYWRGPDGPGGNVVKCYAQDKHGIGAKTVQPRQKHIDMRSMAPGSNITFRFGTPCQHWDHRRKGTWPQSIYVLQVGGVDGRKSDMVPFKHDAELRQWWLELPVEALGCPGQNLTVCNITSIDNRDARGMSVRQFLDAHGRKSMAWDHVAVWELV